MIEQRLTELEIRIAYQDDLLQELNTIVAQQQRKIASLEQACQILYKHINELQFEKRDNAVEPPPPHY